MKKLMRKLFGLEALEARKNEAEELRAQAEAAAAEAREIAKEAKRIADESKLSPKELATKRGEPWVSVLDVKINKENVRNGFFELDWNEFFIKELILAGYGLEADPEEEIVDRWFREIVFQMMEEEGMDTNRGAGYINVVPIAKGKSEVS